MANKDKQENENSKKKKLIIIIIAVVILLAAAGGAAVFFLTGDDTSKDDKKANADKVPVPSVEDSATIGPIINIDEFVVNIISADTPHYVKASLSLELDNALTQPEAEQRMAQIRDAVLLLIGNKTFEELQDLQGKKQLKAELKSRINSFFKTGSVKAIYFTNFVVQ